MKDYFTVNKQEILQQIEKLRQMVEACANERKQLCFAAPGDVVTVGDREMIVLEQMEGRTALILKDLFCEIPFGENNNFCESDADEACQDFAAELAKAVGEENVLEHEVDLTSDDGLKDYGIVLRRASLLTADLYRKYVGVLDMDPLQFWWWLATPYSTQRHGHSSWVKCVSPSGVIGCGFCNRGVGGVRPFCILKSDIFVSA